MITYKKCSEVNIESVYEAFSVGFADYIVKIEMPQDVFVKRFFGPEGNDLNYSYVAFDDEKPVGLILGGIKSYEGIKTLRCGTMCIHPEYRGKGISQKLFKYHKQIGTEHNCKQLFLEVVVGNDRAISFYKKLGYEKIYDLCYYTLKDINGLKKQTGDSLDIRRISLEEIKTLENSIFDIHINWQNDFDYVQKLESVSHYGVYRDGSLIAVLSANKNGGIHFLWVIPKYRNEKIASNLLGYIISDLDLNKMSTGFPNNASLEGFFKHIGFEKERLAQYEMYLFL